FEEGTIERLMSHYVNVLGELVEAGERPIFEFSLLSDQEREQIIVEWNQTGRSYPEDRCIHELFEEQVQSTSDAVALIHKDQQLTYAELNRRANQLAGYLKELGVGPESLVGICVERSIEMVVGLMGILKAGGAYTPLDPGYPKQRLDHMMADSGVRILLTQRHLAQELAQSGITTIEIDGDWGLIASHSPNNPSNGVKAENLAYVIYTSGSTGRPKGIMIRHRNVVNFFAGMDDRIHKGCGDTLLAVTSISFDISAQE